jgi:hypothetical protein
MAQILFPISRFNWFTLVQSPTGKNAIYHENQLIELYKLAWVRFQTARHTWGPSLVRFKRVSGFRKFPTLQYIFVSESKEFILRVWPNFTSSHPIPQCWTFRNQFRKRKQLHPIAGIPSDEFSLIPNNSSLFWNSVHFPQPQLISDPND